MRSPITIFGDRVAIRNSVVTQFVFVDLLYLVILTLSCVSWERVHTTFRIYGRSFLSDKTGRRRPQPHSNLVTCLSSAVQLLGLLSRRSPESESGLVRRTCPSVCLSVSPSDAKMQKRDFLKN